MKVTRYFEYMIQRPDRTEITREEIESVVGKPVRRDTQSDGRIRCWGYIEAKGRYLRVILLEDGETIHNAFYDRDFRETPGED